MQVSYIWIRRKTDWFFDFKRCGWEAIQATLWRESHCLDHEHGLRQTISQESSQTDWWCIQRSHFLAWVWRNGTRPSGDQRWRAWRRFGKIGRQKGHSWIRAQREISPKVVKNFITDFSFCIQRILSRCSEICISNRQKLEHFRPESCESYFSENPEEAFQSICAICYDAFPKWKFKRR